MRRKLTLTMLLTLSAASSQAVALGLGEAEVRSSLNAPLRATIPLTDTAGMEPDRLNVSVAEAGEFRAAGLERTPLAASVGLAVREHQGQLMLDLTSQRAIREPWLDLMLRFDWPGGQSLREVTLLLDPPDYDQLPVLAGAAAAPHTVSSSSSPTPEPAARPVARQAATGQRGDAAWVGSGDTLWSVAGRLRPDSDISMHQMMVALIEANPDVFPSGNINAMRAGHSLAVPSRDAIMARSGEEASRLVQAMNQAWANRGSGAPARVPLGGEAEAPAAVARAPESPTDETTPADALVADSEAVEAAEAVGATDTVADADADTGPHLTLLTDAEVAAEAAGLDAAAAETAEAVAADEAGAEGEASAGQGLDPAVLATLGAEGLIEPNEAQRLARLERSWLASRQALEAVQQERDALQEQVSDLREEMDVLRQQLAELLAGGAGVEGDGAGGVVPPGSAPVDGDSPWWGAVYQAEMDRTLVLGAAGVAGLLGLWLLVRRRRHRDTHRAADFATMPHGPYGAMPSPGAVSAPASGGIGSTSATAASPEPPTVPGMTTAAPGTGAMPHAEVISEADIFMAYGRYDQARDVLLTGLEREPGREDLRLKLLIAYLEQGDWQAAQGQADRLRESQDPAIRGEVERLMAGPGRDAAGETGIGDDRLSFVGDPATSPTDAASQAPPAPERDVDSPSPAGESERQTFAAPDAPHQDPDAELAESSLTAQSDGTEQHDNDTASRDAQWEGEGADVEAEPPPLSRQQSAPEVIDYQPPPLDPEPAAREETPMQPSVEFTTQRGESDVAASSEQSGSDGAELAARRDDAAQWDVEEVAFPPLDQDNGGSQDSSEQLDDLDEARRLLEVGDTERARGLLEPLLDSADDPRLRMQAQELIDRYRL